MFIRSKLSQFFQTKVTQSFAPSTTPFGLHQTFQPCLPIKPFRALFSSQPTSRSSITPKDLLALVANYQYKKSNFKPLKKGNPVYQQVDAALQANPSLMFKNSEVMTLDYRHQNGCAFESAYRSGNFVLYNMMYSHAKKLPFGIEKTASLVRQIEDEAYQYNIILSTMFYPAQISTEYSSPFPPQLIQYIELDGSITYHFVGLTNGCMSHSMILDEIEIALIRDLPFPQTPRSSSLLKAGHISKALYEMLRTRHTVAHFSLDEYLVARNTYLNLVSTVNNYIDEYGIGMLIHDAPKRPMNDKSLSHPLGYPHTFDEGAEFSQTNNTISEHELHLAVMTAEFSVNFCKEFFNTCVGGAQTRFPAWIASLFCSNKKFGPHFNFIEVLEQDPVSLLVYKDANSTAPDVSFYDLQVGSDKAVVKQKKAEDSDEYIAVLSDGDNQTGTEDILVMKALDQLIQQKRAEFQSQLEADLQLTTQPTSIRPSST